MALQLAELTREIIGAAIEVHRILDPGLLESVYEECLCHELSLRGIKFLRQVWVSIKYKDLIIPNCYKLDLLVEGQVVVKLKSVVDMIPLHEFQLLTHLRLTEKRVGLMINFNVALLKDGITRRIL